MALGYLLTNKAYLENNPGKAKAPHTLTQTLNNEAVQKAPKLRRHNRNAGQKTNRNSLALVEGFCHVSMEGCDVHAYSRIAPCSYLPELT